MAQAAGNSCLVCNSLIRSKRRQRDILEESSTQPGANVTIQTRVEAVLNLPLEEDSASNVICDKCYSDLEQIEQYYQLVECFRQRYIIAVQARRKGRASKGSVIERGISSQDSLHSFYEGEKQDDQLKVEAEKCDSESVCIGSESVAADDSDKEDSAEDYTEIFSKTQVPTYEVVGGGEDAAYSESGDSTFELAYGGIEQESEAESEVPLPEKKPSIKKKKHTCAICGILCSKKKMKVHMKMHADDEPFASNQVSSSLDPNTNGDSDNLRFGCKECGKRFNTRHKLLRHTAYHIGRKPYICVICDKKFTWSWHLQRHVKTHSYILPFTCCNNTYSGTNELTQHMFSHKDTPTMECGLCSEMFSTKVQLKQHKALIHGKTSTEVTCNICSKSFKKTHKLKAHMATHSEEYSLRCTHCEDMFKTEAALRTHVKKHADHKCEVCGKGYCHPSSLRIHMMTHKPSKNQCNYCGKEFSDYYSLKRHTNTHEPEKPHVCTECGKSFMRKDHLTKHMTIHSNIKPHICSTCGKSFGRLDKMKSHMSIHIRPETANPTPISTKTKPASTKSTTSKPKKSKSKALKLKTATQESHNVSNGISTYSMDFASTSPEADIESVSISSD